MANPGYPQMGQMPPGMGPPMGGPPMGGPPMGGMPPRPMTRATPKIIPVIVSAGLAVGVFCGLLFGVGTGKKAAAAAPSKGTNAKDHPVEDTTNMVVTPTKPITPTAQLGGSGAGSAAGSGSAVAAAAGSGSGSAVAAVKTTKLTIKVKPEAAAAVAKIQIDGKAIDGSMIEVPSDKKNVKIAVSATGYHSFEPKSYDLSGDEMTIEIELMKRGGSPGFGGADTHAPKVPTRPPGPSDSGGTKTPPKKKPGGLIDI
jgi:hypothetical protein